MSSPFIKVPLLLTSPKSKIRVKLRKNMLEQGIPVATKQVKITGDCYFEWQISYDLKEDNKKFTELHKKNFNKIKIVDQKPTVRYIYELSDLLVEILKKGFIKLAYLKKLLKEIKEEQKFIEDELRVIRKSSLEKYQVGKYKFLKTAIEHPLLIYEISDLSLKIEIIIKERQKGTGVQPMLYLCIPIKLVEEYPEIENQLAETKQKVTYLITKNNFQLVIKTIKIFSILSRNHQRDIINILQTILSLKENIN